MKLDGLFLEYLISGGTALIWIYPLALIIGVSPQAFSLNPSFILVAIPIIFVLGMLIDYISTQLLFRKRRKIRAEVYGEMDTKDMTLYHTLYELSNINTSLVKHLEMRDTRVRASRGMFTNFLFALFISPTYFLLQKNWLYGFTSIAVLAGVTLISWFIHSKNVHQSYRFQHLMLKKVRQKSEGI